jgi:hypothetical protein
MLGNITKVDSTINNHYLEFDILQRTFIRLRLHSLWGYFQIVVKENFM